MKYLITCLIILVFSCGIGTTGYVLGSPWNIPFGILGLILSFFLGKALSSYIFSEPSRRKGDTF